jgi:hypothetical protein
MRFVHRIVGILGVIRRDERGTVLVLAAAAMVVVMGVAALSIDVGLLIHERQSVQNATDAGALAGAQELPDNSAAAQAKAIQYVLQNNPNLTAGQVDVSFRCLISASGGSPNLSDVPGACNPGGDASWTVKGNRATSPCVPASGDKCNVIVVRASNTVDFHLAPVLGIDSGSTGNITSAACRGSCGSPSTAPVDLMMVLDRTSSMSSGDVASTRAAANAVLKAYNPAFQWVGLGLLGASSNSSTCSGSPSVKVRAASSGGNWVPIGLTGTGAPLNEAYVDGSQNLNTSTRLVKAISCYNQSSTGTDLASPMTAATSYLRSNGRSSAIKGIIFMTDGEPNGSTCAAAASAAAAAKSGSPEIEFYTVGFGVDNSNKCPDSSGAWKGKSVVQLLATMATDSISLGCSSGDNTNGDHFFCQPANSSLTGIFKTAATDLASGSTRLVDVE